MLRQPCISWRQEHASEGLCRIEQHVGNLESEQSKDSEDSNGGSACSAGRMLGPYIAHIGTAHCPPACFQTLLVNYETRFTGLCHPFSATQADFFLLLITYTTRVVGHCSAFLRTSILVPSLEDAPRSRW